MKDDRETFGRIARQLIETELMLGGEYMPIQRNPLPAPQPQTIPQPAPQPGGPTTSGTAARPAVGAAALASGPPIGASMTREQKTAALSAIDENEVRACVKCPLCSSRTRTVFGEGDPCARLMFVGEGPGADEDATGRPFVGKAGQLLERMIGAMGLSREQVYIANVVKCRPPGNRTPLPDEMAACLPYLLRQIAIIAPEVIVTLGNPATQSLLQTKIGITRLRGQWQSLPDLGEGVGGIVVMPTFHPSYVLRSYTPENRARVWDDLQKVMDRLGLKKP